MHWILLCLLIITAWLAADLLVACGARLLSLVPYALVRRWAVISAIFPVCIALFFLVFFLIYREQDRHDFTQAIANAYQYIPTITIAVLIPVGTLVIGLTLLSAIGFWPCRGVPYQPRASAWNLSRRGKQVGFLMIAIFSALLMQDWELQWRLARMESRAEAVAQSMKPDIDAEASNAAVYYQQLVAIRKKLRPWEKEEYFKDLDRFFHIDPNNKIVRSYIKELQPLVSCFRKASRCPDCCFEDTFQPLDVLDGPNTNFAITKAVVHLKRYAHQMIQQGQPQEAIECITWIRQLETHQQQDPRNSETVFFFWHECHVKRIVEHLSTFEAELPEDQLRQVLSLSLDADAIFANAWKWYGAGLQKHLASAYSGRAYSRPEFQDDKVWGDPSWRGKVVRSLILFTMRAAFARDDMNAAKYICDLPNYSLDEKPWEHYFDSGAIPGGKLVWSVSDSGVTPWLAARVARNRELSNIGIAACLFHQEKERWPTSLSQLSPGYLPMALRPSKEEQPFAIISLDDGMIVYSPRESSRRWMKFFEEYEDTDSWWQEAADLPLCEVVFLGEAYTRCVEARAAVKEEETAESERAARL